MPFKTFTASVLSSSDVNTYLMKQAVITCTSSTRPASPVQGMQIYETDTSLTATYNGSAWAYLGGWQAYTPTLTNITLGNGTVAGRYTVIGKTCVGWARFTAGSTTTYSAGALAVTVPVAASASYNAADIIGSGTINNGSGATRRLLSVSPTASSTTTSLFYEGGTLSNTTPFTFGTSSQILIQFSYETV